MKINPAIKERALAQSEKIRGLEIELFDLKGDIHKLLPPLDSLDLEELHWIREHVACECIWLRMKVHILIDGWAERNTL